ncbi:RHS repeat domain-containing protein [Bradyrhizobium brasilense]|uniref:RHS repeat protein n=1 Tax=Bradyrhizobium brasilense TaxID=1419277 RepID=A0ABY8JPD6_9BRAD|nr:RHS repeat domain-containing protein [Bradyrhizobium brasilense]WFU66694.1 RHS repeat protein [Bradyrhizobium brasilense]
MMKILLGATLVIAITLLVQLLPQPLTATAGTTGTMTYQYDSLGRLVGEASSSGNSGAYSYDAAGNRLSSTLN